MHCHLPPLPKWTRGLLQLVSSGLWVGGLGVQAPALGGLAVCLPPGLPSQPANVCYWGQRGLTGLPAASQHLADPSLGMRGPASSGSRDPDLVCSTTKGGCWRQNVLMSSWERPSEQITAPLHPTPPISGPPSRWPGPLKAPDGSLPPRTVTPPTVRTRCSYSVPKGESPPAQETWSRFHLLYSAGPCNK